MLTCKLPRGPYPLVWVCFLSFNATKDPDRCLQAIIALYEHPSNKFSSPSDITGAMIKTPLTGVDRNTSFTVAFSSSDFLSQAILSCSINAIGMKPGVTIRFEHGAIVIGTPIYCPHEFTVQYFEKGGEVIKEEKKVFEYIGSGWHFQADEVARCVWDGKKESGLWGHNKSLVEMAIIDEVKSCICRLEVLIHSDIDRSVAREDTSYLRVWKRSFE